MKENFGVGYLKFIIDIIGTSVLLNLTNGIKHFPFRGPGGIVTA